MADLNAAIARRESMHIVRSSEIRQRAAIKREERLGIRHVKRGPLVGEFTRNHEIQLVLPTRTGGRYAESVVGVIVRIPVDAELAESLLLEKPMLQLQALALISGPHFGSLSSVHVEHRTRRGCP